MPIMHMPFAATQAEIATSVTGILLQLIPSHGASPLKETCQQAPRVDRPTFSTLLRVPELLACHSGAAFGGHASCLAARQMLLHSIELCINVDILVLEG